MAASDFVNVELDWWDDMDPFGAELTDPVEILKQDCYHRLIESPGSNIDDPEAGIGIENHLSGVANLPVLEALIDAELQKDERIDVSSTKIEARGNGVYAIHLHIEYDGEVLGVDLVSDASGLRVEGG